MVDENLLLIAVRVTLEVWPSFQMAISNGMGGPNVKEKIEWLAKMVVKLFSDNADGTVLPDDVLEYLDTVLDNEFDTVIDDGSAEMVSQSIVAYYNRICAGETQFVLNKMEEVLKKNAQRKEQLQQASTSGQFEVTPKSTSTVKSSQTNASEMMDTEDANGEAVVDDGWTVVKRKK
ncbi:rRNA accumulation- protein [Tyrophagus putrescentiae]|nr:rRNA accumulation- protein [Tyrophagus putrescentiae]